MKRILRATALLGLVAFSAVSVEGAEVTNLDGEVSNQIVVVNQSITSVRVYVENSEGLRYKLGALDRGQTGVFDAPADVLERGDFRVRVHPGHYGQRFSDPVSIKTQALNIEDGEAVILWLEGELSQSKVEVRRG